MIAFLDRLPYKMKLNIFKKYLASNKFINDESQLILAEDYSLNVYSNESNRLILIRLAINPSINIETQDILSTYHLQIIKLNLYMNKAVSLKIKSVFVKNNEPFLTAGHWFNGIFYICR